MCFLNIFIHYDIRQKLFQIKFIATFNIGLDVFHEMFHEIITIKFNTNIPNFWANALFLTQANVPNLDPGKYAMFRANVSKINRQMCHFPCKWAIFDHGKCAKGK